MRQCTLPQKRKTGSRHNLASQQVIKMVISPIVVIKDVNKIVNRFGKINIW